MKDRHLLFSTAVCIVIIIYGIFSLHIALDALRHTKQMENSFSPGYEIITLNGNKIEYYNI
ncbi:MAG: hypothetical protein IJ362_00285 [Oscillospiraceae bacterium]|nr:hypothetical protein [Oscillospiraceae bacterium]